MMPASFNPNRRTRGAERPHGRDCLVTASVAFILMIGHHALVAPCVAWPVSLATATVHAFGLFVYIWLLRCDPGASPQDGSTEGVRHCNRCHYYVKNHSQTVHCFVCQKCVEGYDHHCTFLNTCVGAKSYRQFLTLIATLFVGTAGHLTLDVLLLVGPAGFDSCGSSTSPLRITLICLHGLLAAACCIGVSVLLSMHAYLLYAGQTTREFTMWLAEDGEGRATLACLFCVSRGR